MSRDEQEQLAAGLEQLVETTQRPEVVRDVLQDVQADDRVERSADILDRPFDDPDILASFEPAAQAR